MTINIGDDNTLILGGFKFSKLQNRRKGILVNSVDPDDSTTFIVVSSTEPPATNGGNDSGKPKRKNRQQGVKNDLEAKALIFCRLANNLLRKNNCSCFIGYEMIHKMVSSGLAKTRSEALSVGKDLSKKMRLFYRVEFKRDTFSDDRKLYKFRPDVLLSIILKSPMTIQKLKSSKSDVKNAKPSHSNELSYSPKKFRKFVPTKEIQESKKKLSKASTNEIAGILKKNGRRPKGKDARKEIDQTYMISQDRPSLQEQEWGTNRDYSHLTPLNQGNEITKGDDQSIYTEVTISDDNNDSSFFSVSEQLQDGEDDNSYMDVTISTWEGTIHSHFEEYIIDDEDKYDII